MSISLYCELNFIQLDDDGDNDDDDDSGAI